MCVSRYKILSNIENATIEDCVKFINRICRIYVIFGIIAIVNAVNVSAYKERKQVMLTIIYIALYFFNIGTLAIVAKTPTLPNCSIAIFGNSILYVYNIFLLIFNIVVFRSYWALFTLIGIFVQTTTLYILYKFREKVINQENVSLTTAIAVAVPAENYPVPSAPNKV